MLKPQRLLISLLLATSAAVLAAGCSSSDPGPAADSTTESTAAPGDGATASTDAGSPGLYTVATPKEEGTIQIYSAPDDAKKERKLDNPRLVNDDPKAKVPLIMLVKDEQGDWLHVALPVRPNGSTGWVRSTDVDTSSHDYHIEITLSAFKLKAYAGADVVFDAPIAVGQDDNPTPGGDYFTTELLKPPNQAGDYGHYALGLSGFSEKITSFNGGPGQLGIHGTNQPEKIGTKVSHGCIRLKNDDIDKLVAVGMPLGTPVIINA